MWRRTAGFKPVYTNQQTRRYKSAHTRWELGQALKVLRVDFVGSQRYVLFASARSVSGFWRVTAQVGSEGGLIDPLAEGYYPSPQSVPPGTGPNVLWAQIVKYQTRTHGFLRIFGPGAPSYPFGSGTSYTFDYADPPIVTISAPYPRSRFTDPFNDPGTQYLSGASVIEEYNEFSNSSLWSVEVSGTAYALDERGYYPAPTGGGEGEGGGGGGGGGGGEGAITVISCNCPDYSRTIEGNARSPWRSEQRSRNWSSSRAGTAGLCKHMFAARKYFNLPTIEPKPDNPVDLKRWLAARAADRALRLKRRRAWYEKRAAQRAADRAVLRNARARDKAEMKAIRDQLRNQRQKRSAAYEANRQRREAAFAEAKRQFQARKAKVLGALHPDASASQEEITIAQDKQSAYDRMEQEMRDREAGYNARKAARSNKFGKKRKKRRK